MTQPSVILATASYDHTIRFWEAKSGRCYRTIQYPDSTVMLHNNMFMGGRLHSRDRFSNWRLDIDNMSYKDLKEDEISGCISKIKGSMKNDVAPNVPMHVDNKCSICHEEYEADEEMGKLCCGHGFHIQCIKQWLLQKNACPVCKTEAKDRC